ncbi:MAG: hypothetical protein O3A92_15135 [Verrucomicrobia bacterium]|nr:hypothetical protein [Verrucomicrobiota bacterium]
MKAPSLLLGLLCGFLTACVSTMPRPSRSTHVVTVGAGFIHPKEARKFHYDMLYRLSGLAPGKYVATAWFENPSPGGKPMVVHKTFTAPLEKLRIDSPPLDYLKIGETYEVRLEIRRGSGSGELVDSHSQRVFFNFDREIARVLGTKTLVD